MVAHDFVFIDDDSFVCANCGMVANSAEAQLGGVCKPCDYCGNVHICHEIGKTPWSMGLETTVSDECCWIAKRY